MPNNEGYVISCVTYASLELFVVIISLISLFKHSSSMTKHVVLGETHCCLFPYKPNSYLPLHCAGQNASKEVVQAVLVLYPGAARLQDNEGMCRIWCCLQACSCRMYLIPNTLYVMK